MLVVPPYLAAGIFNGEFSSAIPGCPGTAIRLDSRQQPFTAIPSTDATMWLWGQPISLTSPFRCKCQCQQIAALNLIPSLGDPDIRRSAATPAQRFPQRRVFRNPATTSAQCCLGTAAARPGAVFQP